MDRKRQATSRTALSRIPSRADLLDKERGTYLKKWKGLLPVGLFYPNHYRVGMSNLGFQLVYRILNECRTLVCERLFLPETDQPLVSQESGRPAADFSVIFISVSFEHDYINLARFFLASGLEPLASRRGESIEPGNPLVVCGGVAAFMNPEPLADFVDLFVVGEAEPLLQLLHQVQDLRLHRDVERRGRLVADQELRLAGQRPGDRDALALTTGEFVRVAVVMLRGQADLLHQGQDLVSHIVAAGQAEALLAEWQKLPSGDGAAIIGRIEEGASRTVLETELAGERILDDLEEVALDLVDLARLAVHDEVHVALDGRERRAELMARVTHETLHDTGFAAPTPVTDGKHVFAVFSTGKIVALDLEGQVVWTNHDVKFYGHHGLAASPILTGTVSIQPIKLYHGVTLGYF